MGDPARFRDSTQLVLPSGALEGVRAELERKFVLSFVERSETVRIVGSPVEINGASDWLSRQGVFVP
jgi:hypothetical protein